MLKGLRAALDGITASQSARRPVLQHSRGQSWQRCDQSHPVVRQTLSDEMNAAESVMPVLPVRLPVGTHFASTNGRLSLRSAVAGN